MEVSAPAALPLGIEAKSLHTPTGAETVGDALGGMVAGDRSKKRRFDLLRAAAGLLWRPGLHWKEQHRTVGCHRHVQDSLHGVEIRRRADGSGARFSGVHTCGFIWGCPVCAEKIANRRRDELRLANAAHAKAGGASYLMTLTFPHERGALALPEMLALFGKAVDRFKNSRTYKNAMAHWKRIGNVKALEITYGEHGWHPHIHEVIFAAPGMQDAADTIRNLSDAWIRALLKAGLSHVSKIEAMEKHAFDLKAGAFVTDYIAKFGREPAPTSRQIDATKQQWGIHSEVTKFTTKIGTSATKDYIGLTPFGLLADYAENGNQQSGALFREYAEAFKGKRQLTWTPGLKKALDIAELEDAEIAAGERDRPKEEHCARLDSEEWKLILQHDRSGSRFALLHVAAKYGGEGVRTFLALLQGAPPSNRGEFVALSDGAKYIH